MALPNRPGVTVPLPGPLHTHRDKLGELVDLGYTDIWSAESDGADGFTPLALAAAWEPRLRLGTAIVPAFTRSPACFAQCVASMADAAPGRFAIGIGSSSNVIVDQARREWLRECAAKQLRARLRWHGENLRRQP